ncbi:NADH-quinone oxidoreductase subunit H [Pigmentibacter sp. JX0631]|uniref:complex I subunit 1/NuoH family protein n=1 Tax=Pigmentibacter sp. JX0631 TaxID=2976982 RepID=UPI002469BBD1|nr:NADH-quinone oxidoreductase subunit H [Pigmentibacter sp. JX0631]WGL61192.1 NADH-quinone oxidoreductase subunit H [Pigmentibacter sp. JX0631]
MFDISMTQVISTILLMLLGIAVGAQVAPIMSWVERRQCAIIQRRLGPNRVGFFKFRLLGLGQPIADAIKLLFKEDFVPPYVHKAFYVLAPVIPVTMGLAVTVAIPWGSHILVNNEVVNLQAVSLNSGFLLIFAFSSLAVYGVTLAGWSSNNKYSLLGGLRASAQMVSYEVAMGLSIIPLIFIWGTLDLQTMITKQSEILWGFLPNWGVFHAPVAFIIFIVAICAETNRLPFDLAESEGELVAGFLTEYGAMRWSLFFLGEYAMMFVMCVLTVSLFFGGYELPWLSQAYLLDTMTPHLGEVVTRWLLLPLGIVVLLTKVIILMWLFVQVRFTIPRFRYDQLMRLGWIYLLPIALVNLIITAIVTAIVKFH